ncbi:MAG: hypothetical protein LBT62_04650, partial [Deltaproteobacteria bacterium]|nr:hypothetical protein [Deltaproteobacteria bacterium]
GEFSLLESFMLDSTALSFASSSGMAGAPLNGIRPSIWLSSMKTAQIFRGRLFHLHPTHRRKLRQPS